MTHKDAVFYRDELHKMTDKYDGLRKQHFIVLNAFIKTLQEHNIVLDHNPFEVCERDH
jgi:hypothetical protein